METQEQIKLNILSQVRTQIPTKTQQQQLLQLQPSGNNRDEPTLQSFSSSKEYHSNLYYLTNKKLGGNDESAISPKQSIGKSYFNNQTKKMNKNDSYYNNSTNQFGETLLLGSPIGSSARSLIFGRQQQLYGKSKQLLNMLGQNGGIGITNNQKDPQHQLNDEVGSNDGGGIGQIIHKRGLMGESQGTDKGGGGSSSFYVQNVNFDLKMVSKKNNFLIGATSTSFTLPVVISANNTTMVGFQNARQKLEIQKEYRKKSQNNKAISSSFNQNTALLNKRRQLKTDAGTGPSIIESNKQKVPLKSSAAARATQRSLIEQVNLPLRGRPVTIGDRTRDIQRRYDVFKEQNEDNIDQFKRLFENSAYQESNSVEYQASKRRGVTADTRIGRANINLLNPVASGISSFGINRKKPVETKIFSFKTDKIRKQQTLVKTSDYMSNKQKYSKSAGLRSQQPEINNDNKREKSIDNILRFLNIGKAEFDSLKNGGYQTKGATIVDMNKSTSIPLSMNKKKNKNDFYRFLLAQSNSVKGQQLKINNDILIPRSILKKCGDKQKKAPQLGTILISEDDIVENASLGNEILQGQHLQKNNPLLSPKLNQLIQNQNLEGDQSTNIENEIIKRKFLKDQQMQKNEGQNSMTPDKMFLKKKQSVPSQQQLQQNRKENINDNIIDLRTSTIAKQNTQGENQKQDILITEKESALDTQEIQSKNQIKNETNTSMAGMNMDNEIQMKLPQNNLQHNSQLNKDLNYQPSTFNQNGKQKKKIIRKTAQGGDGFFETQVELIEQEIILDEDDDKSDDGEYTFQNEFYKDAQKKGIKAEDLKRLLMKKDKIFGFRNYADFQSKYFRKELSALEELNRGKFIQQARHKYANRFSQN